MRASAPLNKLEIRKGHRLNTHDSDCYRGIELSYAAKVDIRAANALLERPAMLGLLPPLAELDVLDVGCGSGWYAQTMTRMGARVTSFDRNEAFVRMARSRLGPAARVHAADLSSPLYFAGDKAFDLAVAPLVMHYLKDWRAPLAELHRVLRDGGRLVFSTHHPAMTWQTFGMDDYHDTTEVEDEWDIGKVRFFHRPLSRIVNELLDAGFSVERMCEPRPRPEMAQADPECYARMNGKPWFLIIRACKPPAVAASANGSRP